MKKIFVLLLSLSILLNTQNITASASVEEIEAFLHEKVSFKEKEQIFMEISDLWNVNYFLDNDNLDNYNDDYKRILNLYYSVKWISVDEIDYRKDLENLELVKNKLFWNNNDLSLEEILLIIMFFQLNNNTNNAYINSFVSAHNLEKQDLILEKLNESLWNIWWVSWYIKFDDKEIIWKSWRIQQVKTLVLYKLNPYEKRSVFIDKKMLSELCLFHKLDKCALNNLEALFKENMLNEYKQYWKEFKWYFRELMDLKMWYDNSGLDILITEDSVNNNNLNFIEESYIYENWFTKYKNKDWFLKIVKWLKFNDMMNYKTLWVPTIYRSYKSWDRYIENINTNTLLDFKYR